MPENKKEVTFTLKIPKVGLEITLSGSNPWHLAAIVCLVGFAFFGVGWIVMQGNIDARALVVGIAIGSTLVWTIHTYTQHQLDSRTKKIKDEYHGDIQRAWKLKDQIQNEKKTFQPVEPDSVELEGPNI